MSCTPECECSGRKFGSVWMLKNPYLALNSFQHVVVLLVVVLSPERVGAVHVGHIDLQLRGGHQRLLDLCFGQFQWLDFLCTSGIYLTGRYLGFVKDFMRVPLPAWAEGKLQ